MNSKQSSRKNSPKSVAASQTDINNSAPISDRAFPIVGIGASAGGLEAFSDLLSHLPIDTGMAFVLVQHLDPSQKSLLTEILSRSTQLPVSEVTDGMIVEPNQVFVIPPNTTMTIDQGILHLKPREKTRTATMSIDGFFCSLAADCGAKTIGVILSGGDDDGSKGLAVIKEAGGITFAQSEDSAQVSSMPNMAIATGHVDFILPPAEIAAKLVSISRHPYVKSLVLSTATAESTDSKDALSTIFSLLRTATRVDFTHYKHTTIKRRIFRRMALYRLEQLDDYVGYLQENPAELQALYQEILINVTSFFRDPESFEVLKQTIFPAILKNHKIDIPLRIWVAACSTGEEAYSIAICLLEFLAHHPVQPLIQIFATDVSELAIDRARLGIYQPNQVTNVSPERLQRFFVKVEGGYQIKKSVRELCIFARQNLISDPPFSQMDIISCRNVFIYFGVSLQKKVLSMFHYGLMPTGYLLLGNSETAGELLNLFSLIDRKFKIYCKKLSSSRLSLDMIANEYSPETDRTRPITAVVSSHELEIHKAADQIVLQHCAPAGVVINADLEILQFRGQLGSYLEPSPGRASLNLLNMTQEGLRLELRTAVHQAKQTGQAVRKDAIPLRSRNPGSNNNSVVARQVCIEVIPFQFEATSENYWLVLFTDNPTFTFADQLTPPIDVESAQSTAKNSQPIREQQEIQQLQQELNSTKTYLQSIIEEQQSTNQDLRIANEEILSSNEELQSTNEELQTAKEEIQATNEELTTINDELYHRNGEIMQVSNDFQNLLGSINIPILMLECDLRIRRFTETAAHIFNLIPTDIGRPFSDIKHNLNIADLDAQILEVISTLHLKSQEVQDQNGYWYDLRVRPYRTLDNRIDGAVVVLVEIDALRRSNEQLMEARSYAEAIIQTVRESLLVLSAELQVRMANQRFYDTFQVSPKETEQCQIFDLGNGQWNIPQLRSLLEDLLPHNTQIENFRVEHNFEHIGQKIMLLNARKMPRINGEELILLAIEDISDLISQ
jgi:two-component system, chemotaxis family, CheB/CheR fusion protein